MTNDEFVFKVQNAEERLYRIAKSILNNDEDCADAIQSAILKAYDKLGTLKYEKYFVTWLVRILINECYGMLRNSKEWISYDEYMEKKEYISPTSEVFDALTTLDVAYRVPFVLHYVEGYSTKEIAKILDISQSNVKIRLQRARLKLQDMLKGD